MSTGINPTTVDRAGPIVGEAYGLKWPEDRPEIVTALNRVRNFWHNLYREQPLFDDLFYCFCTTTFNERCQGGRPCYGRYQGFTLPRDVASVQGVWENGESLTMRSRWREVLTGIGLCGPRIEVLEMAEQFSTERDPKEITALKIFTERDEDAGKKVTISAIDADWKTVKLEFTLKSDSWATVDSKIREIRDISLPVGRKGSITLAQEDGYELSFYDPTETVPSYRRFKITSSSCPAIVKVQCTRRFIDIYFDSDVVEIGDRLVLEAGARYFKYKDSSTDAVQIKTAEYHRAGMEKELAGLVARHKGHAIQDGPRKQGRPLPRHLKRLPGYR